MILTSAVARALELYRLYYTEGQDQPSYLAELHRLIQDFEMREARGDPVLFAGPVLS